MRSFASKASIIAYAATKEIDLEPQDIRGTKESGYTIDGMDPAEWIDAMTMD